MYMLQIKESLSPVSASARDQYPQITGNRSLAGRSTAYAKQAYSTVKDNTSFSRGTHSSPRNGYQPTNNASFKSSPSWSSQQSRERYNDYGRSRRWDKPDRRNDDGRFKPRSRYEDRSRDDRRQKGQEYQDQKKQQNEQPERPRNTREPGRAGRAYQIRDREQSEGEGDGDASSSSLSDEDKSVSDHEAYFVKAL